MPHRSDSKGRSSSRRPSSGGSHKSQAKSREDPRIDLWKRIKAIDPDARVTKFDELPLSPYTLTGLRSSGFVAPTSVQSAAIPAALRGRDVVGVAKTGSGKTLAFLIPLLERLWHLRISREDGLAAIVLSPTRELARQTFSVLRKVGLKHSFSAGLVTGGLGEKQLRDEKAAIGRVNILVGTPGRVLQHLDESPNVTGDTVRLLVVDEVDRMVADGFEDVISGIVDHLPAAPARQSLVFSATQAINDASLARLEMSQDPPPHTAAPHEAAATVTPLGLSHAFCVVPLPAKMAMLFSFLRANARKKIIVFLCSGHMVRYAFGVVGRMLSKYGVASSALTGKMPQKRRHAMTDAFRQQTEGVLFTTDLSARGLDFPGVQWVVQFDPPETVRQYLHRVGRTARLGTGGSAILFLTPQQQFFAAHLAAARVQCAEVAMKMSAHSLSTAGWASMAVALLVQQPQLRDAAVKAFTSTFKSMYHHPLKSVGAIVDPGPLPEGVTEGAPPGLLRAVAAAPADVAAVRRACASEEAMLPPASEWLSVWGLTRAEVVGYSKSLGLPSAPPLRGVTSAISFDRNAPRDMQVKGKRSGPPPKASTADGAAYDLLAESSTDPGDFSDDGGEDSDAEVPADKEGKDGGKAAVPLEFLSGGAAKRGRREATPGSSVGSARSRSAPSSRASTPATRRRSSSRDRSASRKRSPSPSSSSSSSSAPRTSSPRPPAAKRSADKSRETDRQSRKEAKERRGKSPSKSTKVGDAKKDRKESREGKERSSTSDEKKKDLLAGGLFTRRSTAGDGDVLHAGPSRRATKRLLGKQFNKAALSATTRSGVVEFASSDEEDPKALGKELGTSTRFSEKEALSQAAERTKRAAEHIRERDVVDREKYAERVRAKKQEKKRRLTGARGGDDDDESGSERGGAVLG